MISWSEFDSLRIGDFVEYKIWSDPRPVGSLAKVVRCPYASVQILLLAPYQFGKVEIESGQVLIAGYREIVSFRRNYRGVYINESIRKAHPESPLVGQVLRIVPKDIDDISIEQQLALYGERTDLIKVGFQGRWWFVEPEHCTFLRALP